MSCILNRKSLEVKQGPSRALKTSLSAYEFALRETSPRKLVKNATKLKGSKLKIIDLQGKTTRVELDNFNSIYIVGAGKATAAMANEVSSILGKRLCGGAITVPRGLFNRSRMNLVEVTHAGHPLPDLAGIKGTKKIIEVLKKTTEKDLVFCLISGGGSSLLPLPLGGLSLKDKRGITKTLLSVGASIDEINVVRKHLSLVKGGQLMRYKPRGCTVITLIMSDVVGDSLDSIASGPTVPDKSTFTDAANIFKKYDLWRQQSCPAIRAIEKGIKGKIKETPKEGDAIFKKVHNILIGNNATFCNSALTYLKHRVDNVRNLGSNFSCEAKEFGAYLVNLGEANVAAGSPIALVLGGETTVRLNDLNANGIGGRNQEAILSAALKWKFRKDLDIAIICMSTDGIDGNSRAAGAVLTSRTVSKMKKSRIQFKTYLREHNSYSALKKIGALAITQRTGTNLNDIAILCSIS